ncbi:MAG: hypothetical protein ABL995_04405 [Bryobacteraceae bacterium]
MVDDTAKLVRAWVLVLFFASAWPAVGQISPGPLSRAHASLDGATKCGSCHNLDAQRGLKCLECHTEIGSRIASGKGYHSIAYRPSATQIDCARCHQDHNGRQYPVTRFDTKKFDHKALAQFALEGKHAQLTCNQCHQAKNITASAKSEIKVKDVNHSYLGLSQECASCHKDPHSNQLGANCTRCHSLQDWKAREGFDHRRAQFSLTGLHANVACAKCHPNVPGENTPKFKGIAFAKCENCHTDPHRGAFPEAKFPNTCQACHTTAGWKANTPTNFFDHKATDFPLRGKHAELTCTQCHKDNDFKKPVAHALCANCHEDPHNKQFSSRAAGSDCSACHTETRFQPATFTKDTHQKSRFPLEGKHAPLECKTCHQPEGKNSVYVLNKQVCADCHANPHGDEFKGAPYNNRCDQCHTQDRFRPTTFNAQRHNQTKFTLTAAHAAVLCTDCHKTLPVQLKAVKSLAVKNTDLPARNYHFSDLTCVGCHTDPHGTQLTCETCHTARQWREAKVFDHARTKFALEGAHQSVTCAGCHKPDAAASRIARPSVQFAKTPQRCADCHEDIHGGQFLNAGAEKDCTACHAVTRWNDGKFDHQKTSFKLDGAHEKVRCAQCHTDHIEKEGKTIRVYRPTPDRCVDCHNERK